MKDDDSLNWRPMDNQNPLGLPDWMFDKFTLDPRKWDIIGTEDKSKEKVYCSKCEFCRIIDIEPFMFCEGGPTPCCVHPENVRKKYNCLIGGVKNVSCEAHNSDNDCSKYSPVHLHEVKNIDEVMDFFYSNV